VFARVHGLRPADVRGLCRSELSVFMRDLELLEIQQQQARG